MAFVFPPLPSRESVGNLDPEIAGEGQKVLLSNGETVTYRPPPVKAVVPDYSVIKSIQHYFNRTDGPYTYPSWIYHPTEEARVVRNEKEAAEFGVRYRQSTHEERAQGFPTHRWEYAEGSLWRVTPYPASIKFDPSRPGTGKTYMPAPPNPAMAQNAMIAAVVSAVMAQMQDQGQPGAPAKVDQAQWDEFLRFQAWQKAQALVAGAKQMAEDHPEPSQGALGSALSQEQEWNLWEEEAKTKGVKVDHRWSLDRLKAEVEKAA